jgi:uncharacterized protein involved in exopolysaccharide biosynthesis
MNNQLTVAQILGAIQRHRIKALLAWALVMFAVVVLYLVWPREYRSEGQLYVKMDRNNASMVPSTSGAQVAIQDTRATEINSVIEIVRSRGVLDAVVDEVGADEILEGGLLDYLPSLSMLKFGFGGGGGDDGMSAEEYKRLKRRELASNYLVERLHVVTEKKSSVILVSMEANSPSLARQIVESIFKNARRTHTGIHDVSGSAEFFDDQFDTQQKELKTAVQSLADFRNELGVTSVGAERASLQGIVSTIDQGIMAADVALVESVERVSKLKELIAETSAQVALPKKGVERLSYEDSRTEYFKLQQERERLKATYTDKNVRVMQIDKQLARLKQSLDSMKTDRTESSLTPNPVYQELETDMLRAKTKLAGDRARLSGLKKEKAQSLVRLKELNNAEVAADEKLRNVEVARQYLAIYTKPRGESKAIGMLDDRNISDVRVAQKPTLTLKPANPKASLVLPLGFVCGLLAAFGTALFFDRNHLSASLNESEVEQVLDLPVLISLPRVYSSRNMVN